MYTVETLRGFAVVCTFNSLSPLFIQSMHAIAQDFPFGLYWMVALSTYDVMPLSRCLQSVFIFSDQNPEPMGSKCVLIPSPTSGSCLSTLCLCHRGFSRYFTGVGLSLFVLL